MMNQIDMEENKYNEAKVYICIRGLWKLPVGPFIGFWPLRGEGTPNNPFFFKKKGFGAQNKNKF